MYKENDKKDKGLNGRRKRKYEKTEKAQDKIMKN